MYAVNIESFGNNDLYIPMGNDGVQKLHNKTRRGWLSETYIMRHNGGTVYVVNDFTQAMCEMSPGRLVDYVMKHHVCILPRVTNEEVREYMKRNA